FLVSSVMVFPGWIRFTIPKPIDTAITVVTIYVTIVLVPIFESLEISLRSDIPFTRDARIKGTAISLRALIKIFPKGLIQSPMKPGPQEKFESSNAKMTPAAIPSKICQCNANFFILKFYDKLKFCLNLRYFILQIKIGYYKRSHGFYNRNGSRYHTGIMSTFPLHFYLFSL